ncbi:MAG: PH domain-containing protein [Planctomycetia bacterium]|nr:PH domain-containing protein [Planctomycetia bacterium]
MNDVGRETAGGFTPYHITRPAPVLMWYYVICAFLTGPGVIFAIWPYWFKYETLRYKFDEKGVSMSWGIIFRRETLLTYRRIQDIHLTRNILQRWLGLATVSVQTASGSATAEMSIDGILEAEALRDFLYTRMRGAKGLDEGLAKAELVGSGTAEDESLRLLHEIRDAMRTLADRERNVA